MAQETDEERKTSLLKLAMEMDEERKARLKKMVAITQLKLASETEDERRARWNICQKTQSIYLTRRSVEHWTRANGTWLSKLTE